MAPPSTHRRRTLVILLATLLLWHLPPAGLPAGASTLFASGASPRIPSGQAPDAPAGAASADAARAEGQAPDAPEQAPEPLFAAAPPDETSPAPDGRFVVRSRLVSVDAAHLSTFVVAPDTPPDRLVLNLFDDAALTAVLERAEAAPSGDGSLWIGWVDGQAASSVVLVVHNGQVAGNIWLPGAIYQIRPLAAAADPAEGAGLTTGGLHTVVQIDGAALPEDYGDAVPVPAAVETPRWGVSAETSHRDVSTVGAGASEHATPDLGEDATSSTPLDLLVVYTPAARERAGGHAAIALEIEANVAVANASFANSGVEPRLQLVQAAEVDYVESGSLVTDLYRLSQRDDGFLEPVHALRDAVRADLVALWVASPNGDPQGVAWLPARLDDPWAEATGFSVMAIDYIAPFLVFPHELGHNLGADHDWYADEDPGYQLYPYSHGQVSPEGGWCTIMAYRGLCVQRGVACTRIPYWSNPGVAYAGRSTGVAPGTNLSCTPLNAGNPPCDADNRLTLNQAAQIVTHYRGPAPRLDVTLSLVPARTEAGTGRIAYTLTVHNLDEAAVTGMRIADTLPAGATYVAGSASHGGTPVGDGQIVWSGLTCAPQESLALQFEIEIPEPLPDGGVLVHILELAADGGGALPPTEFSTPASPHSLYLPLVL